MEVGDRVYLISDGYYKLKVESAVIEKVTPKKIKLASYIYYSTSYFKDDSKISRSFEEARAKFIAKQEKHIEVHEEQIADAKSDIAKAKVLECPAD